MAVLPDVTLYYFTKISSPVDGHHFTFHYFERTCTKVQQNKDLTMVI